MPDLPTVFEYYYLGDRQTDAALRKANCRAVRKPDGKCIRGKNGSMLVEFEDGRKMVVVGRLLRKVNDLTFLFGILSVM